MTQDLADLVERSPLAQHLGGQSMAELMSPVRRGIDPGALDGTANDTCEAAGALKAMHGRSGTQKYSPRGAARSPMAQIGSHRIRHLRG